MTGISHIGELIELTKRLTAVMEHEVDLLGGIRAAEVGPLQEEKSALSAAYSGAVGVVNKDASTVANAAPNLRDALEGATTRLKEAMADNLRAITVARTFNERLIMALGEAVAAARPSANAYTAGGARAHAAAPAGPTAIALDDRI